MSTFTFEEKKHAYFLDGKPLMGITTILGTIAKPNLIHWASKMACEYIRENAPKELLQVPEGEIPSEVHFYEVSEELLEQAVNAHARKKEKAAQAGTDVHAWIEQYAKDPSITLPEDSIAKEQARQFVEWVEKNKVKFLASEKKLYSEKLWCAGTLDAILEVNGKKYMVDFKTMAKIWDRTPFLQMAGYRIMAEEMGEDNFDGSVVVLLPKGGKLEEKFSYDYDTDKKGFLACLELYKVMKTEI